MTIAIPLDSSMTNRISASRLWTGRILTGLSGAFMLLDGVMKLARAPVVVQATVQLGYPESAVAGIGMVLLISTLLYLIPRTSVLGAVLLTAYLGGAVASKVRVEADAFNILAPVVFAAIAWAGLYLRDGRLERRLPVTHKG